MTAQILYFFAIWRFYVFFLVFFFKKLRYKKTNRTWISQPYCGVLSGYIQGLQIWRPNMTAQILYFFAIWRFYVFFLVFFFKKLRYKKTNRTWISQPYSGLLSGYSQGLQIWSPILTAQILLVFENWRFLWFFHIFFSKKIRCKKAR